MIEASNINIQTALQAAEPDAAQKAASLAQTGKGLNMEKIDAAAKDFEAMFMTEMLKPMFQGIQVDSVFGGGKGEEVFRSLMLDEYGKIISKSGGLGIADKVKAEMIRIQEAQSK